MNKIVKHLLNIWLNKIYLHFLWSVLIFLMSVEYLYNTMMYIYVELKL